MAADREHGDGDVYCELFVCKFPDGSNASPVGSLYPCYFFIGFGSRAVKADLEVVGWKFLEEGDVFIGEECGIGKQSNLDSLLFDMPVYVEEVWMQERFLPDDGEDEAASVRDFVDKGVNAFGREVRHAVFSHGGCVEIAMDAAEIAFGRQEHAAMEGGALFAGLLFQMTPEIA